MKLIDREPTQEMLKAIASSDCAPSNYKQMFQSAYDAAPEVNQEPVAIVGELYPQTKIELSRKGIPVGAFLYTLPPDAQVEIAKLDARIETLEIRLSGFSDLTGLMQSSLEGDTSRISELLDQNEKQAAEITRIKGVIAKCGEVLKLNLVFMDTPIDQRKVQPYTQTYEALAAIKEMEHD